MSKRLLDIEEANDPVVGSFYRVPTLFQAKLKIWIPVLGQEHHDREIIGFPDMHWHVDWRFVTDRYLAISSLNGRRSPQAVVVTRRVTDGTIVRSRLKLKRRMPVFPGPSTAPWLSKLEDKYADARSVGLICPHRSIRLHGCPVENGVVVCPGHGLAWHIEDGHLVRRSQAATTKGAT